MFHSYHSALYTVMAYVTLLSMRNVVDFIVASWGKAEKISHDVLLHFGMICGMFNTTFKNYSDSMWISVVTGPA